MAEKSHKLKHCDWAGVLTYCVSRAVNWADSVRSIENYPVKLSCSDVGVTLEMSAFKTHYGSQLIIIFLYQLHVDKI